MNLKKYKIMLYDGGRFDIWYIKCYNSIRVSKYGYTKRVKIF